MRSDKFDLKPLMSVIIIVVGLFFTVLIQMEERRIGYEVLSLNRTLRKATEDRRALSLQVSRQIRPQNVERVAQRRSSLKKIQDNQIIYLTGTQGFTKEKKELN